MLGDLLVKGPLGPRSSGSVDHGGPLDHCHTLRPCGLRSRGVGCGLCLDSSETATRRNVATSNGHVIFEACKSASLGAARCLDTIFTA